MARYVIEGPKAGVPKSKDAGIPSIKREERLGEHEYYGGDVLSDEPKVDYEAKGKELVERGEARVQEAKTWAEKKFGGFFSSMRDRAATMATHIAKGFNIALGGAAVRGAEAASVTGRAIVETAKVPGHILKGGLEMGKFVAGEAADVLEATGEVIGTGVGKTVEAGIAGVEAAQAGYREGVRLGNQLDDYAEDQTRKVKDATIRGAKTAAKGAAVVGAVGAGTAVVGAATVGAAAVGAAALGAAAAAGTVGLAGYGAYKVGEAGARFAGEKAAQGRDALNDFGDRGAKAIDSVVATGKLGLEAARSFATSAASAIDESVAGLSRVARAEAANAGIAAKKFGNEAAGAVETSIKGLGQAAREEAGRAAVRAEAALNRGIASTVDQLRDVKHGIQEKAKTASEAAARDLKRVEADVERGSERLNALYDRGVETYTEYNGRVNEAKSAWDDFRNAGRQALEAFTSIFKSRGEKKKLAQEIVTAIDAQKQLDALRESGS